ncbi:undecaprenyl-diphosphate phosphatase [Candidatus Pelagibacter bacterium]|nr:undecaprenyl-diphosphate phosphatase [Candidatus Pelagibacter bacterium]
MIEILILSLVQGITEFLPVSSSSHLILFSKFVDFKNQGLSIDVSLHIGSFIAVLTYFYKDIFNFIENRELFIKITISSIPVILIGYILVQTNFIDELRNIKIIAWMTVIFGILLYISDKFKLEKEIKTSFNLKVALIIGCFQAISLIPGVSRSGITITAARLLNFKRFDSAKISFLLSIPTLAAVSIYGLNNVITTEDLNFSIINLSSIFLSFLFSFFTIKFFLKYIQKFNLNLIVAYRIILGLILLYVAYL